MSTEREKVLALVREELQKRLRPADHPALLAVIRAETWSEDEDVSHRPACVIEPDKPCYNSGYCRRLGY